MAGNILSEWGASAAYTFTSISTLGSSSTLLAGAEAASVDHEASSVDAEDYHVGGKCTVAGSGLSIGVIAAYVGFPLNDTPDWPDVLDGTDSAETFGSEAVRNASVALLSSVDTITTGSLVYPFKLRGIARLADGKLPKKHTLWVTQSTGAAFTAATFWRTPTWSRYS